jgi:predicted DNA binding CopG/RHH family protein
MKLTKDEKSILKSYEDGEWKSTKDIVSDSKRMKLYAKSALRKDKRVNIRISENDLVQLQRKAVQDGLPYQTLISSVLHKFINGRLVETEGNG